MDANRNGKRIGKGKVLVGDAGSIAEGEPHTVLAGDGPVQKPHTLVLELNRNCSVVANSQATQFNLSRASVELGGFQALARKLGEKLIEATVFIRGFGRLVGRG